MLAVIKDAVESDRAERCDYDSRVEFDFDP
jgi:hypothetical protein